MLMLTEVQKEFDKLQRTIAEDERKLKALRQVIREYGHRNPERPVMVRKDAVA